MPAYLTSKNDTIGPNMKLFMQNFFLNHGHDSSNDNDPYKNKIRIFIQVHKISLGLYYAFRTDSQFQGRYCKLFPIWSAESFKKFAHKLTDIY